MQTLSVDFEDFIRVLPRSFFSDDNIMIREYGLGIISS